MALQAVFPLGEDRFDGRVLFQGEEQRTVLRIHRNDFNHIAALDIADVDIVVEIDRAGSLRVNMVQLQARLENTRPCDDVGTRRAFRRSGR